VKDRELDLLVPDAELARRARECSVAEPLAEPAAERGYRKP